MKNIYIKILKDARERKARKSTNWRLHSIVKKEKTKRNPKEKIVPYLVGVFVVAALISSICILIGGMV